MWRRKEDLLVGSYRSWPGMKAVVWHPFLAASSWRKSYPGSFPFSLPFLSLIGVGYIAFQPLCLLSGQREVAPTVSPYSGFIEKSFQIWQKHHFPPGHWLPRGALRMLLCSIWLVFSSSPWINHRSPWNDWGQWGWKLSFITLVCLLHRVLVGFHLNRVGCEGGTRCRTRGSGWWEREGGWRETSARTLPTENKCFSSDRKMNHL